MGFDAEYLELMPTTVTWSTMTGFDGYGEPAYSTGINSCRARISRTPALDVDQFGSDVVVSHKVIIASTSPIEATATFTIEGGNPTLLRVEQVYDEEGVHHQVAYFGAVGGG